MYKKGDKVIAIVLIEEKWECVPAVINFRSFKSKSYGISIKQIGIKNIVIPEAWLLPHSKIAELLYV